MSALEPLFGKYVTESSSELGYSASISRPFIGWFRQVAAHEQARATLLGALGKAFSLRVLWDELDGLGLDGASWVPVAPKTRAVPANAPSKTVLSILEPGGWLIYGASSGEVVVDGAALSGDDALAAGADVALTASFDSDRWELRVRRSAMPLLERHLQPA